MAEEQTTETTETDASGQDSGGDEKKKKTIIYVVIGGLILLVILLIAGLSAASSEGEGLAGILKIVNIQPASPTTSPTPTPQQEGNSIISGSVAFQGVPPSGSTVAIGERMEGASSWTPVITDLPAREGVTWSWTKAVEGANYEVQAFNVSSTGSILFQSPIGEVKAPESGVELTILISDLPPPPDGSLKVTCNDVSSSSGKWRVTLTYNIDNPTSSALQYRLGIATSKDGELVLDVIVKPASPDTTQIYQTEYIIDEGRTYYSAYAYSDSATGNDFSEASSWVQFQCNPVTGTPSPASTSTPTPTSGTTSTPTP